MFKKLDWWVGGSMMGV